MGFWRTLITTNDDAMQFINRLDVAIVALDRDVASNLVYADPAQYRSFADQKDAEATANEATGNPILISQAKEERQLAAFWRAEADKLAARALLRTADRVKLEIDYSQAWEQFYQEWTAFVRRVREDVDSWLPYNPATSNFSSAGDALDQAETYDSTYRRYYHAYENMGLKPSTPLPPTPEQVAREHQTSSGFSIPWGTLAVVAAAVAGGYLLLSRRPSSSVVVTGGAPALSAA